MNVVRIVLVVALLFEAQSLDDSLPTMHVALPTNARTYYVRTGCHNNWFYSMVILLSAHLASTRF